MRSLSLIVTATLVLAAGARPAIAAERPDLSGTWVLDKDRSFSNPAGFDQIMTIVQSGGEVKLEATQKSAQGERIINESWTLDGQEREFTPPTGGAAARGKRKASWLPGDRGILVWEEVITESPKGPVTQQTQRKWTLSSDGRTLTVDFYIDNARGSFETKRVYTRR